MSHQRLEVMEHILLHMEPLDRLQSSLTCRKWAEAVSSSVLLDDIWLVLRGKCAEEAVPTLLQSRREYRNLRIFRADLSTYHPELWTKIGASLHRLQFIECSMAPDLLRSILRHCSKLKSLEILDTQWKEEQTPTLPDSSCLEEVRKSLVNVRHFCLSSILYVENFDHLLGLVRTATSLELRHCYPHNLRNLITCMARNGGMFTELNFHETPLSDDQLLEILRRYSGSLKVLRLSGRLLTTKSYSGLSVCGKLQQFDLIRAERFEDIHVEKLVRNAPNLEILGFDECASLTSASVACIHDLKKIQKLRLNCCESLTSDALCDLGRIQTLRHVYAERSNADNRFLRGIACLKDLRSLAVDVKISPESFDIIWRSFEKLESLCLANCKRLKDAMGVRLRSLRHLKTLSVGNGVGFTNVTFMNGLGSSDMEQLSLHGCSMTDIGLAGIAANHRRLRELSLAKCNNITDGGLANLLRSEPFLQKLELQGCQLLTKICIRELETTCPRLQYLSLIETRINSRVARWFEKRRPSVNVFHFGGFY